MVTRTEIDIKLKELGRKLNSGVKGEEYKQTMIEYTRLKEVIKLLQENSITYDSSNIPESLSSSMEDYKSAFTSLSDIHQSLSALSTRIDDEYQENKSQITTLLTDLIMIIDRLNTSASTFQTISDVISIKDTEETSCPPGMRPATDEALHSFFSRHGKKAPARLRELNLYVPPHKLEKYTSKYI